jgi:acetylornithine deacetylase/succinyl-diaminopimelate desuccinylase-like protein
VEGGPVAVDARAGEFLTQVPATASVTLAPRAEAADALAARVKAAVAELAKARPELKADVALADGKVVLTTHGNAVHSSVAFTGQNALWDLAAVCDRLKLARNGVEALLTLVAQRFDGDHWAKKLGLAYEDPQMGGLLVVPTLLRVDKGKATLSVNMRRPRGLDATAFTVSLSQATGTIAKESGGRIRQGEKPYIGDPHVAELSGTLANTLLDIYRRHQNTPEAKAGFIRGGTYARLFPGAVDFGPAFPGEPYTGHAPDESIALTTLSATTEMLAQALYALAVAPAALPEK